MRGKAVVVVVSTVVVGITPAYAGKRFFRCSAMHRTRDHPRLCGEKPLFSATSLIVKGSPPPMRGKGICGFADLRLSGITPAYAGKRLTLHKIWQTVRDHPRLCGEKMT